MWEFQQSQTWSAFLVLEKILFFQLDLPHSHEQMWHGTCRFTPWYIQDVGTCYVHVLQWWNNFLKLANYHFNKAFYSCRSETTKVWPTWWLCTQLLHMLAMTLHKKRPYVFRLFEYMVNVLQIFFLLSRKPIIDPAKSEVLAIWQLSVFVFLEKMFHQFAYSGPETQLRDRRRQLRLFGNNCVLCTWGLTPVPQHRHNINIIMEAEYSS